MKISSKGQKNIKTLKTTCPRKSNTPQNKSISNLFKIKLSLDDLSVLEVGLSFYPSTKNFDKNKLAQERISVCAPSQAEGIFFFSENAGNE